MRSEPIAPYGVQLRQRNLSNLLELYELNYALLLRLAPVLEHPSRLSVAAPLAGTELRSPVAGEPELALAIRERTPYTLTVHLTYWFEADEGLPEADPDLLIRIYHDARQAETLHCGRNYHCDILRQFRGPARSVLERRWQVNGLLHKWLQYLLQRQHRFPVLV